MSPSGIGTTKPTLDSGCLDRCVLIRLLTTCHPSGPCAPLVPRFAEVTLGSYVVDCPNRERLGYGGDSVTSMEMGMTNFQTAPLYSKWLYDWRDSQVADGDLPHTAPSPHVAGGGPAWSGICVTMPWQVYLQFGDQRILEWTITPRSSSTTAFTCIRSRSLPKLRRCSGKRKTP